MALVCKLLAVLPQGRSLKALGGHPTRLHNEGHNGGRCGQVVRSVSFALPRRSHRCQAKDEAPPDSPGLRYVAKLNQRGSGDADINLS